MTFDKQQEFFDHFRKIFFEPGICKHSPEFVHEFGMEQPRIPKRPKKGKIYYEKPAKTSKYADFLQSARTKGPEIEIFYGYKKIYVIIKSSGKISLKYSKR